MFTALTYLATSLTLAILVSLARRQHHEEIDGSEQYRYPSLLVKVIGFATPMYAAMAAFIYFRDSPEERSAGFIFSLALVFGTFIIGNTVAYFYFRSFVIDLNPSCMTVSRLGRLKNIPWEQVATIIVVIGLGMSQRDLWKTFCTRAVPCSSMMWSVWRAPIRSSYPRSGWLPAHSRRNSTCRTAL